MDLMKIFTLILTVEIEWIDLALNQSVIAKQAIVIIRMNKNADYYHLMIILIVLVI